ncbi:MAG: hypothetical protein A4E63_02667 [Syntrophorhabdus sp. PtaU1.Bin050]|nr:MAG: hypothetical protein A4E63_02667 [Syntrophorhabdus sp. PtaU1.Bin050]
MLGEVNVVILTEGSEKIGLGHLARCVSLCQAFESRGIYPHFIVKGGKIVWNFLSGRAFEVIDWTTNDNNLRQLLDDHDVAIIDSYSASLSTYQYISELVRVPVYIDDYKRLDYPRGLLINVAINAENLDYPKKEGLCYLLGGRYILLRKEFWDVPHRSERNLVENIILTFGGTDVGNMTARTLWLLKKNWSNCVKNVIIGPFFHDVDAVRQAADSKTHLFFSPPATQIRDLMFGSDIAVSAAGQTLYELARIGVPAVTVMVADNQANNVKAWVEKGCILDAGWANDSNVLKNIDNSLCLLCSLEERRRLSTNAKMFVDGLGPSRIVDEIMRAL